MKLGNDAGWGEGSLVLCKHENLRSDPWYPWKSLVWERASIALAQGIWEQADPYSSLAHLAKLVSSRYCEKPCVEKIRWGTIEH